MRDRGWIEGQTFTIEARFSEGKGIGFRRLLLSWPATA
jgi:hypothetical protein